MIDRYTIKFGPALSQRELEKAFAGTGLGERRGNQARSQNAK
jgi:hypothetical protein